MGVSQGNNKKAVEVVLDRVTDDGRKEMVFVCEGEVVALVASLDDDKHIDLGDSEHWEEAEDEEFPGNDEGV